MPLGNWRACLSVGLMAMGEACANGLPILHPAQPLPSGVTSLSAGEGSHWVGGQARREIHEAQLRAAGSQGGSGITPAAATAASLWSPGLFPWLSMRMGLGSGNEVGACYAGQDFRLDARHAVVFGRFAFSVGLGGIAGLLRGSDTVSNGTSAFGPTRSLSGLDASATKSFGFDVPLMLGWRSSVDIARIWLALSPSYAHAYGNLVLDSEVAPTQYRFESDALTLTGTVGLAMGLRPIFIAMELGFGESRARGSMFGNPNDSAGGSASVSAFTLTPATALIWELH
jgi:hypothetical protein